MTSRALTSDVGTSAIRKMTNVVSGFIPAIATIIFAYDLLYTKGIPLSLATWLLIFVLDAVALVLVYKGGDKRPWLLISWTFAAACVIVAILSRGGRLNITLTEVATFLLCLLALWQWMRSGRPVVGLRWQSVAMWVSSIPMFHDFWVKPEPSTWWLWAITLGCCVVQVAVAEEKKEINILVQLSAIGLNAAMLYLIYR